MQKLIDKINITDLCGKNNPWTAGFEPARAEPT